MRSFFVCIVSICLSLTLLGQENQTLSLESYVDHVLTHNPLTKQIQLELLTGRAERRFGRGGFDPMLSGEFARKEFDEKVYYNKLYGNITIPTPLGIQFNAGYEQNSGVFLNPENSTKSSGLYHLGIEVEPLSGLVFNKRMTDLTIGNVRFQSSKWKSQEQENKLVLSAVQAYIDWRTMRILDTVAQNNLSLANQYLENTVTAFNQGEKSAIDTLEASIYVQDAIASNAAVQAKLQKANQILYLYAFDTTQFMQMQYQPDYSINFDLELSTLLADNYPALNIKQIELKEYRAKQRMYLQDMLPKVKLKFNPLLYTEGDNQNLILSENNYKAGISIKTSLFQTQKRAKYQLSNLKLEEKSIELQFYQTETQRKLNASIAEYQQLVQQHTTMQNNVLSYQRLLEAEQVKFNLGESSVFLLNKRQEKFLTGLEKLAKLEASILFLKEFLLIQYGTPLSY